MTLMVLGTGGTFIAQKLGKKPTNIKAIMAPKAIRGWMLKIAWVQMVSMNFEISRVARINKGAHRRNDSPEERKE